ncbi:MAG: hypothetical protein ABJB74_05900 [Gemmatimonas sp.]
MPPNAELLPGTLDVLILKAVSLGRFWHMHRSELIARVRSLWRGLRNRDPVDKQMLDEFHLHIELRTADLIRTRLTQVSVVGLARHSQTAWLVSRGSTGRNACGRGVICHS